MIFSSVYRAPLFLLFFRGRKTRQGEQLWALNTSTSRQRLLSGELGPSRRCSFYYTIIIHTTRCSLPRGHCNNATPSSDAAHIKAVITHAVKIKFETTQKREVRLSVIIRTPRSDLMR